MKKIEYYTNRRDDLISLLKDRNISHILEVGGGHFDTLKHLVETCNAKGVGVDPVAQPESDNDQCIIHRAEFDKNFIEKNLRNQEFDLILAGDVLEHVLYTDVFLNDLTSVLSQNGHLVISVPNIRQLRALYNIFIKGTFPRDHMGLFDDTHLRWFCRKDLIQICSNHGLKVVKHRYKGRFVRPYLPNIINEFLALQNLFIFTK